MDRERVEGKSFLLCRLAVLCSFFVVLLLWGFASSWCNLRLACVCVGGCACVVVNRATIDVYIKQIEGKAGRGCCCCLNSLFMLLCNFYLP